MKNRDQNKAKGVFKYGFVDRCTIKKDAIKIQKASELEVMVLLKNQ
jgi:hypothetical protein